MFIRLTLKLRRSNRGGFINRGFVVVGLRSVCANGKPRVVAAPGPGLLSGSRFRVKEGSSTDDVAFGGQGWGDGWPSPLCYQSGYAC